MLHTYIHSYHADMRMSVQSVCVCVRVSSSMTGSHQSIAIFILVVTSCGSLVGSVATHVLTKQKFRPKNGLMVRPEAQQQEQTHVM